MIKYVCDICAHEYKQSEGDPASNIAPGTPWEQIPATWTCPICGCEKKEFIIVTK